MIIGTGSDILDSKRLGKVLDRFGERFINRCFTPAEIAKAERRRAAGTHVDTYAKRFAAKEALGKALGIGVSPPATLQNSAVSHDFLGKPIFVFAKPLAAFLAQKNAAVHLSISDEKEFAIAFVVIENEAAKQELFS